MLEPKKKIQSNIEFLLSTYLFNLKLAFLKVLMSVTCLFIYPFIFTAEFYSQLKSYFNVLYFLIVGDFIVELKTICVFISVK